MSYTTEQKMKVAFRDMFYWALVGESNDPSVASNCIDSCGEISEMCCASIQMHQGDSIEFEKHCINLSVVEANFEARIGNMDLTMKCDTMEVSGAIIKALSSIALTLTAIMMV
jgi:hypothetical protein